MYIAPLKWTPPNRRQQQQQYMYSEHLSLAHMPLSDCNLDGLAKLASLLLSPHTHSHIKSLC